MNDVVPASTRVRVSRVGNVDTDRLLRRLDYLRTNQLRLAQAIDGHGGSGRGALPELGRELMTLERELYGRDALDPWAYRAYLNDLADRQSRQLS